MDSNASYVTNFFLQQHISLNEEWLEAVLQMLQQQPQRLSQDILTKAVFQQWIYSNISESTHPSFQLSNQAVKIINGVYVFQITSVYDIGSSVYSQYRAATHKVDNFDFFDALPKEEQPKEMQFEKKANRMLLFELSDGLTTVKAIEYRPIPQISSAIMPGAKMLIYGSVQRRNNYLWLTAVNCQLLGGDLDTLCQTNQKETFLGRKLKIDKYKKEPVTQSSQSNTKIDKYKNEPVVTQPSRSNTTLSTINVSQNNSPLSTIKVSQCNTTLSTINTSQSNTILSFRNVPQSTQISSTTQVSPIGDLDTLFQTNQKENLLGRNSNIDKSTNEPTLPKPVQKRPPKIEVLDDDEIVRPPVIEVPDEDVKPVLKRPPKIEVPDDDVIVLIPSPSKASTTSFTCDSPAPKRCRTSDNASDTPLIAKFKELKLLKITQALQLMKFSIGSKKVRITALLHEILEPFTIEDGEWTMKIRIRDETHDNLDCFVSHQLLCRLIGMTPDEAIAIRNSTNFAKRKEGTERIKTLDLQLQRLDLIFEIEFFAANRATPRIIEMETLTDALQIS